MSSSTVELQMKHLNLEPESLQNLLDVEIKEGILKLGSPIIERTLYRAIGQKWGKSNWSIAIQRLENQQYIKLTGGGKRGSPRWIQLINSPIKSSEDSLIVESKRSTTLAQIAARWRSAGLSEECITLDLLKANERCIPKLPDEEVRRIVSAICKYPTGPTPPQSDSILTKVVSDEMKAQLKVIIESWIKVGVLPDVCLRDIRKVLAGKLLGV